MSAVCMIETASAPPAGLGVRTSGHARLPAAGAAVDGDLGSGLAVALS